MAKAAKILPEAIPFSYAVLVDLLGKPVDDPAVQAVIAKAGKTKVDSDFIVAKQAGFDFALERKKGVKKKVLDTLFLFSHGADDHSGFAGLPKPFSFADRATLRKAAKPDGAWTVDDGDVAVDHPDSKRDTWKRDGLVIDANYNKEGFARYFTVQGSEESRGGRDLSTHPLHFETKPVDAPKDAELVGMALIVAWSADRFGLPKKHAGATDFAKRAVSPVTFLKKACDSTLTTLDIAPELGDFFFDYTNRLFLGTRAANRDATAGEIKKLLKLERKDERAYTDDFLGTFKGAVKNPFNVPDSWSSVDRIAPILDARWADYQATAMKAAPKLALYEKAAKLRDAVRVTAASVAVAKVETDDALAKTLIGLIGAPVKEAKATLEKAGLPIGKRIDEQANPAAGIAYMGSNLKLAGKTTLCVTAVDFYAAKEKAYIRGLGKEVEFDGYRGSLVLGVKIGDDRKAVAKAFGAPSGTREESDYWYPDKRHRISATFSKRGKLDYIHFSLVEDWEDAPKPPFGPKGIF